MTDGSAMPREVAQRADDARLALGTNSIEWTGTNTADMTASTKEVLSVESLPFEQTALVAVLQQWRDSLGVDAEIHLIERSRLDPMPRLMSMIRARLGVDAARFELDVVAAVRSVGLMIIAIDRIDVETDGGSQRWVDLRATDVAGQVHRDTT